MSKLDHSIARGIAIFWLRHRWAAVLLSWMYQALLWTGLALVGFQLGNRFAASEKSWTNPLSSVSGIVPIGLRQSFP